jgi:hypothetical protein
MKASIKADFTKADIKKMINDIQLRIDNTDVSVVIRGTIYVRRAPAYPAHASLPTIIFSQSR